MSNDMQDYEDFDNWVDEAIANLPSRASLGTAIDVREIMEVFAKEYAINEMCSGEKWYAFDWDSWIECVVDNLPFSASLGDALEIETRLRNYASSHPL